MKLTVEEATSRPKVHSREGEERAGAKRISIQITFQFLPHLLPLLDESAQGRRRSHLSSGLGRALVKRRPNGARDRYTYLGDSTCTLDDSSRRFSRQREFY